MNLNNLPVDIEKLKDDLKLFCSEHKITKFEVEDIVELLEDGEDVKWIVEQLQSENSDIDTTNLMPLLTEIKSIIGPSEEEEEQEIIKINIEKFEQHYDNLCK